MEMQLFFSLFLVGTSSFSADCPLGYYKVIGHNRTGFVRTDGTLVRPTHVKEHCRKLTLAYEFMKTRFKEGLPPDWPHKIEKAKKWTTREKEKIIQALEVLPDLLLNDQIQGFYRMDKSKYDPNPASNADGIIVLYNPSFSEKTSLDRVIAHELIHQVYLQLSEKDRQSYRRATGWHYEMLPNREFVWAGRKAGYVAEDGVTSPEEDFANNLEYFLYNPDRLKTVTPSAYDWIRKRYGDKLKLKDNRR